QLLHAFERPKLHAPNPWLRDTELHGDLMVGLATLHPVEHLPLQWRESLQALADLVAILTLHDHFLGRRGGGLISAGPGLELPLPVLSLPEVLQPVLARDREPALWRTALSVEGSCSGQPDPDEYLLGHVL